MFILFMMGIGALLLLSEHPEIYENHLAHWAVSLGFSPESVGLDPKEFEEDNESS